MTTQAKAGIFGASIVLALVGLFAYSDLYLGTYMTNFFHHIGASLVFALVFFVIAVVAGFFDRMLLATVLAVGGVVVFFGSMAYGNYLTDQAYAKELTKQEGDLPGFAERTAWEVANNRVDSDKGDLKGDALGPRYRPEDDVFGTLVDAPGFTAGYAGVIEQRIAATGETKVTTCKFGDGTGKGGYRLGGNFDGSLEREISHLKRGLIIDSDDAYGYCDGDTAVAVVPVQEYRGFYPVTKVPAGVAVYRDGQVTLKIEVKDGELPGPVYPTSLAARQRSSLAAVDSTWWTWLRGKAGYTEATTEGDPNSENPTEFILADPNRQDTVYVTPMTDNPKQKQAKISSYVVLPATSVTAGKREAMKLYLVPVDKRREANGVVVDNIKSFYSDADYGWAQGLKVFEMLPAAQGEWVASLGYEKSVKFRVYLKADGSSCLEDTQGNQLRCVDASGTTIGEEPAPNEPVPGTDGTPLEGMTNAQLAKLQAAITAELVKRAEAAK